MKNTFRMVVRPLACVLALAGALLSASPAPVQAQAIDPVARGLAAKALKRPSSVDVIAGSRTGTPNGTLNVYSERATGPDGVVWPGPYGINSRVKIPLASIAGGGTYYRCKAAVANWYQGTGVNLTTTATASSGTNALTMTSTTGVQPGMTITGSGIPNGTTVLTVSTGAVTISQNTTGALSSTSVNVRSTPGTYGSNTGEVGNTGGPIQVARGWRAVFGSTAQPIPETFGGAAVATLSSGSTLWGDWVYGTFTPGQSLEIVSTYFWPAGSHLYSGHMARADFSEGSVYSSVTGPQFGTSLDYSGLTAPSWSGTSSNWVAGPASVVCSTYTATPQVSVVIIGDSTGWGSGDNLIYAGQSFIGDSNGHVGAYERMLGNLGVGYTNLSQPSKRLVDFNTSWKLSAPLTEGATHAILSLGINDVATGTNLATMQSLWISAVQTLQSKGLKVIAVTVGTETTTTDGGVTTANQTAASGFTVGGIGSQFNDWLRTTGAPTYTGGRILDLADAVMSARNSQKFRVDIAPFADWWGFITSLTWVPGTGGTNGTWPITATGGGCTTAPAITATVSGGGISSVVVNNVGVGCTSNPTFSTATITGLTGGSFTASRRDLTTGIHYLTITRLTGATLTSLGTVQTGGTTTDANGTIATALQPSLAAALAN